MSVVPGSHHDPAIQRGANCHLCPLANTRQGPVMGEIKPTRLLVVAEAPTAHEVEEGRPWLGSAGEVIERGVVAGGLSRAQVSFTNAVLCRPPGGDLPGYIRELRAEDKKNKTHTPTPLECCAPRLAQDIRESTAQVLLAVGGEALRAVAHKTGVAFGTQKAKPGQPKAASVKKQHGSPIPLADGRILAASLHPAYALHGGDARFLPVIEDDIRRAAAMAVRGEIGWKEPEFLLGRSAEAFITFMDALRLSGARVTIDIETDHRLTHVAGIRCVGLGAVVGGREVVGVVPLRRMAGGAWWPPAIQEQVERALTSLLDAAPLAGHNLLFDTAVLLRHRFMSDRRKRWMDTMLAHKDTNQSELPHDLGFVAARVFDAPRWKEDADAKSVDGVDDHTLHRYCAKDVLGEMRLVEPLANAVVGCGQLEAYRMDSALAPVARDMGDLGLVVDDKARLDIYEKLDKVATARLEAVRSTSGIADFNPNASKQIAKFLYVTQGLTPPFTTDGDEWGSDTDDELLTIEGEEPDEEYLLAHASTNRQSLLKLLELGVDDRSRAFINALMGYRQMEKIKSTFVGLAPAKDTLGRPHLRDVHREKQFLMDEHVPGFGMLPVLHTSWKLHVVPSGRWASQPACQNWPERVVYDPALYRSSGGEQGIINTRRMIVAPKGHIITGADYNAVELRLYAAHAKDKKLIEAFNTGKDAHALNFASMMAKNEGEIMTWYERVKALDPKEKKAKRNIAKRFVYLIIYGGQKDKLFKTMAADRTPDGSLAFPGLKEAEVAFWFDNWHKMHPETLRWQKATVQSWMRDGFVASRIYGRRRFFLGGLDPNAIVNHTIQGTAADIANRAMERIAQECPHRGWSAMSGPILQVHDFIGLQVPIERQKEAEALLEAAMPWRDDVLEYGIEIKSGPSWADV